MSGIASHADLGRAFDAETARAFERVADLIEPRIQEVAAEVIKANAEQIPGYEASRASVRGTARMLELLLRRFRRGEPFNEEDAAEIAQRVQIRAKELPFDALAESFHVGARRVVSLVGESARELRLDGALMFAVQDRAWEWGLFASRVIADVQREHDVSVARRDATHRSDFLRDLVCGRMTAARLAEESAIYGLDMAQPYFAVCAQADEAVVSALEASIRRS